MTAFEPLSSSRALAIIASFSSKGVPGCDSFQSKLHANEMGSESIFQFGVRPHPFRMRPKRAIIRLIADGDVQECERVEPAFYWLWWEACHPRAAIRVHLRLPRQTRPLPARAS